VANFHLKSSKHKYQQECPEYHPKKEFGVPLPGGEAMAMAAERHETAHLGPPAGEPGAKYHAMTVVAKAHASPI